MPPRRRFTFCLRASAPSLQVIKTTLPSLSPPDTRQWFGRYENQLLLLLLLAAFPLYYELGRNPVQLWDESRVAVNAAGIAHDGHWLVPTYEGAPEHWNTKPPLLLWLQAMCIRALGYSTWALRLPTLVATLGTLWLLFRFSAKVLGRPLVGLLSGMVLVTCAGYVRLHVARTGDYDALLTFWQVLVWTAFFQYLETGTRRHLVWFAIGITAATLTKGPAGLLGGPGLVAFALARRKLWWLLRQPGVYAAAGAWLVVVGGYYWARESVDPGYWAAVQNNDLGGRFLTALDNHSQPWDFYLLNLQRALFSPWLWALGPALLVACLQPAGVGRRAAGLLIAFTVGWLVVISSAQSKLDWYDAPIYPALSLLVGMGLSIFYQELLAPRLPRLGRAGRGLVVAVAVLSVFYGPYHAITRQLIEERHSDYGAGPDGHLGQYVTKLAHEQPQVTKLTLLTHGMQNSVLWYYKYEFEQYPGRSLNFIKSENTRSLPPGTVVMTCDPAFRPSLDSAFQVVELHQDGPCQTLLLAGPK